ncbi:hypothetical protein [Nocardioides sp. WS12]|uniref:hypothetical protein n=1 Tax=Nocardioides sp. WS12 TaxID=2486272 RepID=UPI0015F91E83|nr:hypothetical protein [Nocardioides sp. WS12]
MTQAPVFIPWRSIAAGVVDPSARTLSYGEALESPCATCSTSPCCTHLPVHTFSVSTVGDLSYAAYLLNFDRIRLGVTRVGEWSVYYVNPCRFLDTERMACTVHATDKQPNICQNYSPYQCWYKRSMTKSVTEDFVFVDRARLDFITERVQFDEARNVIGIPDWDELVNALASVSDEVPWDEATPVPSDHAYERWQAEVVGAEDPTPAHRRLLPFADNPSPCSTCSAPCCETLEFAQGFPTTKSSLDFFQFCLGFPGVELSVSDAGWSLAIKTTCRHLTDGRCGVYGQPERPLFCRYYDAWKCTYRDKYLQPRPTASVRVRLDELSALTECIVVDENGKIATIAPVDDTRAQIEASWRKAAGLEQAPT